MQPSVTGRQSGLGCGWGREARAGLGDWAAPSRSQNPNGDAASTLELPQLVGGGRGEVRTGTAATNNEVIDFRPGHRVWHREGVC